MNTMSETAQIFDVAVIGAGAAGLFAACRLGAASLSVCVIEKNDQPGRKLLIAGSTRCNITHSGSIDSFLSHYGSHERFVKPCLYAFPNEDLLAYFSERGISFTEMENGKVFPASMRGSDILEALLEECRRASVSFRYGSPVRSLTLDETSFVITSSSQTIRARSVLISTGGKSYPKTGSSGDGYALASAMGHSIVEPLPALTPAYVRDYRFELCSGISLSDVTLSLYRSGKRLCRGSGDVLFTHRGLSGPGILDFSRNILPGDMLRLSFVDRTVEELDAEIAEAGRDSGKRTVKTMLARYSMPERLLLKILELCSVAYDMPSSQLDKSARRRIVDALTGYPFIVDSIGSFDEAMATRGGVSLSEVDPRTMQSRIAKKLYFAGEVLDVDGDTGGYNLQFAFSSAALAAEAIVSDR